jgi:hypothetical protein
MNRPRIPQRVRVYLGCEGRSEQSYGARLGQIANSVGRHVYIDNDVLGGGDPLALVDLAVRRIAAREAKRGDFVHRAVLLDRDRLGLSPDRDRQIAPLARRHGVQLIWQSPCHEGFLLRHFEGQEATQLATSDLAMQALTRVWPEYRKGTPANGLALRIDRGAILRAAAVEPDLRAFLALIGLATEL